MATVLEARLSMQVFFKAGWAGKTAIAYDNRPFTPAPQTPWVRFSVLHDADPSSGQQTLGAVNLYRRTGNVAAQIFMPKEEGTEVADGYVQDILDIFDGKNTTPENVTFEKGRSREGGPDGVWSSRLVLFDFRYDEIK